MYFSSNFWLFCNLINKVCLIEEQVKTHIRSILVTIESPEYSQIHHIECSEIFLK